MEAHRPRDRGGRRRRVPRHLHRPGQWPGGFTANVAVTDLGDAITGWRLTWTFAAGQRVTQAWNATVTGSGNAITATDAGYNAAIPASGTVSFGFNGSWTGSNPAASTSWPT